MDSGVLNRATLNHLEFTTESTGIPATIPLPDELPPRPNLSSIPREILATSTVENLISQNEDLMARLKVSLRRLSTLEMENKRVVEEAAQAQQRVRLADDQVQVFREKDSAWKAKAMEFQRQRDAVEQQLQASREEIQKLQTHLNEVLADRFRLKRYQEKIRTQVKPHMVQLKDYAQGLELRLKESESSQSRKDAQIQDLRDQVLRLSQSSKAQIDIMEKRFHDTVRSYEDQVRHLEKEAEGLRSATKDLEVRVERLRKTEQRCDQLENEVIELRRQREEINAKLESENRAWIERTEGVNRENARLQIENEDLKQKTLGDYDRIRELEQIRIDLQSQLDSMRFLWQSRNDENDRLKVALGALEKLNLELSRKLQEVRSPEPTSGV